MLSGGDGKCWGLKAEVLFLSPSCRMTWLLGVQSELNVWLA